MNRIIHLLQIEKIALHGYGLGYAEGKAVFVPYTMPGDCVDVRVRLEKKDVIFGTVAEYRETSKQGITPQCEAFGGDHACGGCDWLMAPYQLQLKWKTDLIREQFEPLKLSHLVRNAIASPQPQCYRNKSFLPAGSSDRGLYFGMYERYSHNVVPHQKCLLQPPVKDEALAEITAFAALVKLEPYNETTQKGILRHVGIRINQAGDEILLILVTKGGKFPFTKQFIRTITEQFPQVKGIIQNINRSVGNVILADEEKLLFGTPYLTDILNGTRFRLHYKSFFQINSSTAELLYDYLKQQLGKTDVVLDAFCGSGSIGLCVADQVQQVIGVEEVTEAVADAEFNRQFNSLCNVSFRPGRVEDVLPDLVQEHRFSAVIFDPPRKGVEAIALQTVADHKIPLILYVSCNPMTLARDVKLLVSLGYKVQEITPFDMFPQTWHIETVVKLARD